MPSAPARPVIFKHSKGTVVLAQVQGTSECGGLITAIRYCSDMTVHPLHACRCCIRKLCLSHPLTVAFQVVWKKVVCTEVVWAKTAHGVWGFGQRF